MDTRAGGIIGLPNNGLLAQLEADDFHRLRPLLTEVQIRPRQILHHWRMPMEQVYFIESGLVSVAARTTQDAFVEVWLTGSEGMTGVPVVLCDDDDPPHRRVVQVGGTAWRMAAAAVRQAMQDIPALRRILLRYVQVVLMQTSQSGACNAHHEVKQRIARWLLLARDALRSDDLPLTHEVLGRLLGIRRASVSQCLSGLESERLVQMSRGLIRVADGAALEAACCDCYRIIRREQRRLLAIPQRAAPQRDLRGGHAAQEQRASGESASELG